MTRKTNSEFISDLMDFSDHGALMHCFVIEALRVYSEITLAAPKWEGEPMFSQVAWKGCAKEFMDQHKEQYGKDA